jgi:hypothetical protein
MKSNWLPFDVATCKRFGNYYVLNWQNLSSRKQLQIPTVVTSSLNPELNKKMYFTSNLVTYLANNVKFILYKINSFISCTFLIG